MDAPRFRYLIHLATADTGRLENGEEHGCIGGWDVFAAYLGEQSGIRRNIRFAMARRRRIRILINTVHVRAQDHGAWGAPLPLQRLRQLLPLQHLPPLRDHFLRPAHVFRPLIMQHNIGRVYKRNGFLLFAEGR